MATKTYRRVLSAGTLTGDEVRNLAGEKIGKIEEIMIDVEEGVVSYAVLSFGGFLGMGDKLFAVPWKAMTIDEQHKQFILNTDKEVLKRAEGFDKNNWPDFSSDDVRAKYYSFYNVDPYWS